MVTPDNEYCFRNLGIQCVKKTEVNESLKKRKQANVDPFKRKLHNTHIEKHPRRLPL